MTSQLITDCELNYNGIAFPMYTAVMGIAGRPVYDSAGRTVTHVVWTLTVQTTLTVDSTLSDVDIGDEFVVLRAAMTRPGGRLYYRNNGFGDFEINTDNADVTWGPRPKMLSWKPAGKQYAIDVTWQVEVAIAECDNGNTGIPLGSPRPPLEYCWNVSYSVDKSGYTTKTINGHIMIAQTRRSVTDRTLADHADRLRESIEPRCPEGFQPGTRSFNLSEDKCRLDFTFSFEQMPPNIPPTGCVLVKATHNLETPNLAMARWNGTISATYEMRRGLSRRHAAIMFMDLLKSRIGEVRQKAAAPRDQPGWNGQLVAEANATNVVIPTRFSMTENIYERESASFSLSYLVTLAQASLPKAIEILGIFKRAPETPWSIWYESLRGKGQPLDPRGVAGLTFDIQDDRILDLCLNLDNGQPIGPQQPGGGAAPAPDDGLADLLNAGNLFKEINPFGGEVQPLNSWLDHRNALRVEQVDNNVEQRLLPVEQVTDSKISQQGYEEAGGGIRIGPAGAPGSVIQRRGKGMIAVILEGRAVRAAYAISPPTLNSIAGVDAIPANRDGREFFRSEIATSSIYPICVASWRLRWILPEVPNFALSVPENPMHGKVITGNGSPPFKIS